MQLTCSRTGRLISLHVDDIVAIQSCEIGYPSGQVVAYSVVSTDLQRVNVMESKADIAARLGSLRSVVRVQ